MILKKKNAASRILSPVPWSEASLDNLVKQWYSIDSVFALMETTSQQLNNVSHSRVGMFRSDAMFLTPIDVSLLDRDEMDVQNRHAVLAPFGKHPVNDRMICGPLEGVKVWATKRFELVGKRVRLRQQFKTSVLAWATVSNEVQLA
jgi:hypothetical protein